MYQKQQTFKTNLHGAFTKMIRVDSALFAEKTRTKFNKKFAVFYSQILILHTRMELQILRNYQKADGQMA